MRPALAQVGNPVSRELASPYFGKKHLNSVYHLLASKSTYTFAMRSLLAIPLFLAAHIGASAIALQFLSDNGFVATFWPPTGIALAALLLGGYKYLPWIAIGAFAGNMLASCPIKLAALFALTNTLQAVLAYVLLTKLRPISTSLERARDYFRVFLYAGMLAPLPSAILGATALYTFGATTNTWLQNFEFWWMGDSLGAIIVTPLVLVWHKLDVPPPPLRQIVEGVIALIVAFIAGQVIFAGWFSGYLENAPREFMMLIFIVWAAVRFGRHATLFVLVIIIMQVLKGTIDSSSSFHAIDRRLELVNSWLFIAISSVTGMALATFIHERKQTLERLSKTSHNLEHVSAITAIGGWELDVNRQAIWLSNEARRILEIKADDILTKTELYNLTLDEYRMAHIALVKSSIENKIAWDTEYEMTTFKGRRIWVRSQGEPVVREGKVVQIRGIIHDITERKKNEKIIEENRDRFSLIFRTLSEGVTLSELVFDESGNAIDHRILEVNEAFYTTADYNKSVTPQGALATELYGLSHAEIQTFWETHRHSAKPAEMEYFNEKSARYFLISVSPYRQNQFITSFFDITESKKATESLREANERLSMIFKTLTEGVSLNELVYDEHGEPVDHRIIDVNEAFYTIATYDKSKSVVGASATELYRLPPNAIRDFWREHKNSTTTHVMEFRNPANGKFFLLCTSPVHRNRFVTSFFDITSLKQSEIALRESEERYRQLIESSADAIFVHQGGVIVYTNRAAAQLLGAPATNDLIGMNMREIIPLEHRAMVLQQAKPREGQLRRLDGTAVDVEVSVAASKYSEKAAIMIIARDISDRKVAEEKIRYLGQHDSLTQLPNRTLFADRLSQTIARAAKHDTTFALLFLDADHFKKINDSLGHQTGDLFLREVANRLVRSVKSVDTVSRQGGDEFLILLNDLEHPEEAATIAQRICTELAMPFVVEKNRIIASVSIGVAVYPRDGQSADTLIKNADIAMYHAKDKGRNQFQFYSEDLNRITHENIEIEAALRDAIALGQLRLYYQPQLDLASGRVTSCEALLRWIHPERGMVSPGRFIPIAEETGLIVDIGRWVLATVADDYRLFSDAGFGNLRISINASAEEMERKDFSAHVSETLATKRMPPTALEIEVTESMIMKDTQHAIKTIEDLSGLGIKFSIDDFGTGYSSLSYLRQLKIHNLKIDQSFVRDLMSDADDAAIVRTIIGLAKNLRLQVTGEGVETKEQMQFLKDSGCDLIQGYDFSEPLPLSKFLLFLQTHEKRAQNKKSRFT